MNAFIKSLNEPLETLDNSTFNSKMLFLTYKDPNQKSYRLVLESKSKNSRIPFNFKNPNQKFLKSDFNLISFLKKFFKSIIKTCF